MPKPTRFAALSTAPRSEERTNIRNGYRHRDFDTRVGTVDLAIPKLRSGSYFPDWLIERRLRDDATLVSVVATSRLLGVSTRRMEKLVATLGIDRLCKSQVSTIARDWTGRWRPSAPAHWTPGLTRSWRPTRWCLKVPKT